MIKAASVRKIAESLEYFAAYIKSQAGLDDVNVDALLSNYVSMRQDLARDVKDICTTLLIPEQSVLEHHLARISAIMTKLFGSVAPPELLQVNGYRGIRGLLLEYLARHVGEPVPVSRMRVLSGDQVHTERRVRELRDLGFDISWKRTGGEEQYVLKTLDIDLEEVAYTLFLKNVNASKSISSSLRQRLKAMVSSAREQ